MEQIGRKKQVSGTFEKREEQEREIGDRGTGTDR
jgi:hypothetical protein